MYYDFGSLFSVFFFFFFFAYLDPVTMMIISFHTTAETKIP